MAVISRLCWTHGRLYEVDCKCCIRAQAECPAHKWRERNDCPDCCDAAKTRIALRAKRVDARAAAAIARRQREKEQIEKRIAAAYSRGLELPMGRRRKADPAERKRQNKHDNGLAKLNPLVRW